MRELKLPLPQALQFWALLIKAIGDAKKIGANEVVISTADGDRQVLSLLEAAESALHLGQAIKRFDDEDQLARRAAGWSPIAEQLVVIRDERGEAAGMEKTFRY